MVYDGDSSIAFIAKWAGGSYVDTCSAVGINDIVKTENEITIFPNPVSDNLTVETTSLEKKYLSIYNVMGEKSLTLTLSKGEGTKVVNVSALRSGVYFVEVRDGKNIIRKKFIKQ